MFDLIKQIIDKVGVALVLFLPDSPFQPVINRFAGNPMLGYLNWLVPVNDIINVMFWWLYAIIIYYLIQGVLRAAQLIG